ncbi:hypothetical protein ISS37_11130 [candidate division KSB1 bacterium]|nr:hypothetical protein [candidate division KSB1 bacterium]
MKIVIRYDIKETCKVVMKVYNLSGQEVITVVNEFQEGGNHRVNFDASGLGEGDLLLSA